MGDPKYWDDRARRFGHTGWAAPLVYAFDQTARMAAIERIIASAAVKRGLAVDFGAGTGDFANLLAKYFERVVAFDISPAVAARARRKYGRVANVEFFHGETVSELAVADNSVDLFLSVTVLGHIVDDRESRETLKFFRRKISESGLLITLEATPAGGRQDAAYQRFLTREKWRMLFAESGFALRQQYGFYNPDESGCKSYDRYLNDFRVRLFRKFNFGKLSHAVFRYRASKILASGNDCLWDPGPEDPMSLMIFTPEVRVLKLP
jgi:ubiquinone/menaquinone biosynthesis C-methylase UbiE